MSERIKYLTEHLKANHKDFGTQKALIKLVGKRRALLDYLKDATYPYTAKGDKDYEIGKFKIKTCITDHNNAGYLIL